MQLQQVKAYKKAFQSQGDTNKERIKVSQSSDPKKMCNTRLLKRILPSKELYHHLMSPEKMFWPA